MQNKNHGTKAVGAGRKKKQVTVLSGEFNLPLSVTRHQKEASDNEEDLSPRNQPDTILTHRPHLPVHNIYPDSSHSGPYANLKDYVIESMCSRHKTKQKPITN